MAIFLSLLSVYVLISSFGIVLKSNSVGMRGIEVILTSSFKKTELISLMLSKVWINGLNSTISKSSLTLWKLNYKSYYLLIENISDIKQEIITLVPFNSRRNRFFNKIIYRIQFSRAPNCWDMKSLFSQLDKDIRDICYKDQSCGTNLALLN